MICVGVGSAGEEKKELGLIENVRCVISYWKNCYFFIERMII